MVRRRDVRHHIRAVGLPVSLAQHPRRAEACRKQWGSRGRAPIELCAQQAHNVAHAARSTKSTQQGPETEQWACGKVCC